MLRIKINNTDYLDLPADFSLSLVYENPFFLNDRIPVPGSISFDLPTTANNLALLSYPDHVTSEGFNVEYPAQVEYGPFVFLRGLLLVMGFDQNIKALVKGVDYTSLMKDSVRNLNIERKNFATNPDWHLDYQNYFFNSKNGQQKFVCPPIRVKRGLPLYPIPEDNNNADLLKNLSYGAFYNWLNWYDVENGTYLYQYEDTKEKVQVPMFPAIFVKDLFESVFNDQVFADLDITDDWAKLIIPTTYFPNYKAKLLTDADIKPDYNVQSKDSGAYYLELNQFLPEINFNELFREILKLINVTLFSVQGSYVLLANKTVLARSQTIDWTAKAIGGLNIAKEKGSLYLYGYSKDFPNDESLITPNYTAKNYTDIGNATRTFDLTVINAMPDEPMLLYIQSTGEYFKVNMHGLISDEGINWQYSLVRSGLSTKTLNETSDNTYEVVSKINPMPVFPQTIVKNDNFKSAISGAYAVHYDCIFAPEIDASDLSLEATPKIMLWHGLIHLSFLYNRSVLNQNYSYPYMSWSNILPDGTKNGKLSLQWDGEDGLLNNFHKEYKEWIERDKIKISGTFLLDVFDLQQLDLSRKVYLNGRNFFIEKVSVTINADGIQPAFVNLTES